MPSSADEPHRRGTRHGLETTLRGVGVKWLRKVRTYGVGTMMSDAEGGP